MLSRRQERRERNLLTLPTIGPHYHPFEIIIKESQWTSTRWSLISRSLNASTVDEKVISQVIVVNPENNKIVYRIAPSNRIIKEKESNSSSISNSRRRKCLLSNLKRTFVHSSMKTSQTRQTPTTSSSLKRLKRVFDWGWWHFSHYHSYSKHFICMV